MEMSYKTPLSELTPSSTSSSSPYSPKSFPRICANCFSNWMHDKGCDWQVAENWTQLGQELDPEIRDFGDRATIYGLSKNPKSSKSLMTVT